MKKTIFFAFLVLLASTMSFAGEKTITAVADPWPPFVDPSHPKEGISLEIVRSAFKTQGYEVKMEYVPWARAIKGVKDGKYDILPNTWVTEERKGFLMYSDPYAANNIKFVKRKDDPFEFNGLQSLTGKKIGTVRGYGYGTEFLSSTNFTRDDSNNIMQNVMKLIKKRVDLTLDDEIVARMTIAKDNPEYLEQVSFTENSLSSNDLHITSGFKNPRHKEIINSFNKGLKVIKGNGVYKAILADYGIK